MHPAPQVQYPLTLQEPSCCIVRTLSILTNVVAIPDISLSRRVDFVIGVSGRSMEDTRHFRYTDKMEFHVIELPKLPVKESYTKLELWAKFINAEEKEEFDMIAEKDPYIDSAYRQLQIISQDKQLRMEYEAREKAMRDNSVVTVLLFTVIAAGVITGCGIGNEGDGRVRAAVADAGSSQDGNGSSQESGLPKSESEAKVESPQRNLPWKRKRRQKPLRRNPQCGRRTFTP